MPNTSSTMRPTTMESSSSANFDIKGFPNQILEIDILRINGYLRLANVIFGSLLGLTGIYGMFCVHSYGDFLIVIYILAMTALLIGFEFRDRFPALSEKVKMNLAFMFTAFGRACYILAISFLAFTQGGFGIFLGVCFMLLSAFNFFIIYRHPGYRHVMTEQTTNNGVQLPSPKTQTKERNAVDSV